MKRPLTLVLLFGSLSLAVAQGPVLPEAAFGNEWIRPEQKYYAFRIGSDGIFRLSYEKLVAAGIPAAQLPAESYRLYRLGQEVRLFVSSADTLRPGDYLEFAGRANRGELDRLLYENPMRDPLNPGYSQFSDSSVYFLSWTADPALPGLRYRNVPVFTPSGNKAGLLQTRVETFSDTYVLKLQGERRLSYRLADYEAGEGYGKVWDGQEITLDLPAFSGGTVDIRVRWVSLPGFEGTDIQLDGSAYAAIPDLPAFSLREDTLSLSLPVGSDRLIFSFSPEAKGQLAVGQIKLTYPRSNQLPVATLLEAFSPNNTPPGTLDLEPSDATKDWLVLDQLAGTRWMLKGSDGPVGIATTGGQRLIGLTTDRVRSVEGPLKPVRFPETDQLAGSYLIVAPRQWLLPGAAARAYADYRRSSAGGGFKVRTLSIESLYFGFAYGIDQHPLAMRNLARYLQDRDQVPDFVLLVGKGYSANRVRNENGPLRQRNLLPTYGLPGSDNLLFGERERPEGFCPVGRIAAADPDAVLTYLDKVKAHETGLRAARQPNQHSWRKKGVFLAGGKAGTTEHFQFLNYLRALAEKLERNGFGGNIDLFGKTEETPLSGPATETVIRTLEQGAGLKVFLGHGGVRNTDFGLDDPQLINNGPRFPLTFSLGCYSGNLFTEQVSLSEEFVLAAGRGSLAYLASTDLAAPSALYYFASTFFDLLGEEYYARPLGELLLEARRQMAEEKSLPLLVITQLLSFHGDPALRLHVADGPDFTIEGASFRTEPGILTTDSDSLQISFRVHNLGKASGPSILPLRIRRTRPDGSRALTLDTLRLTASLSSYQKTFSWQGEPPGTHRIEVLLDPDDRIAEVPVPEAEANNELRRPDGSIGITFPVIEALGRALWPADFGITGRADPPTLRATAPPGKKMVWEIDTAFSFDSPFLKSQETTSGGSIHQWQPEMDWQTERVYYWRVALSGDSSWDKRSFVFLPGHGPGWNQSHFGQLLSNPFSPLRADTTGQKFNFPAGKKSVLVESNARQGNSARSRILVNNERVFNYIANWPSIGVLHMNPQTSAIVGVKTFRLLNESARQEAMAYLRQPAPVGALTIILTAYLAPQPLDPAVWETDRQQYGENLPQILSELGNGLAMVLDTVGIRPYLLLLDEKGQVMDERVGMGRDTFRVSSLFFLEELRRAGTLYSLPVGPVQAWGEASWQIEANTSIDSTALAINNGRTTVSLNGDPADLSELPADLPLQFSLFARDTAGGSLPEVVHWRIGFQPLPDPVADRLDLPTDSLQEGAPFQLDLHLWNASESSVTQLPVAIEITGPANQTYLFRDTIARLNGFGTEKLTFRPDTRGWNPGPYRIVARIDPDGSQQEQDPKNNQLTGAFTLTSDRTAPVLQVTFDGRPILQGDLVSANPLIVARLTDENQFLDLNDTSLFTMIITSPKGAVKQFGPSDPEFHFFARETKGGVEAVVELNPRFSESGTYLLQVQATDASGNPSGSRPYEISFLVETESRLSRLLPYPNPFSTATRFQYTLTGSEAPLDFRIQIMTVNGEVVREIDREEFGPMRIGTHLSDFVWDGTDQFGDRLANGVYLYRVLSRGADGKPLPNFERAATERFFRAGMGKIVILR